MNIGENIKRYRKIKGLTQSKLADNKKLDISVRTLQKYESGEIKPPLDKIKKLSAALGVSVSALISEPFSHILLNKITNNITSNDPIKEISNLTNIDSSYLLYTYSSNAEFNLDTEKKLLSLLGALNKDDLKSLHDDITIGKKYIVEDETINFIESLLEINNSLKINHKEYLNNQNYYSLIESRILDKSQKYNILITDSIINDLICNIDNLIDFELFKIKERILKKHISNDNK